MNIAILSGRMVKDPEVRYATGQNGQVAVCKFSIAVPRGKEETDFVACTAFGKNAENLGRYMAKGRKIVINRKLRQDRWEEDWKPRVSISVMVESWEFGDKQSETTLAKQNKQQPSGGYYVPQDVDGEDLPF